MNEELDYAEMLEIPVETVTVKHRESKKRAKEPDLQEQLVEQVNEHMEENDPAYAESKPIARESKPAGKRAKIARRIVLAEFIAVCALCAAIFLTNIFMTDSAINTFVRGLFNGNAATADTRVYSDFTLSPVVNEFTDVEITVSETGVMSFTAKCHVYAPCAGTVKSVSGAVDTGYTIEIEHSENFSSIISGLDYAYVAAGETVYGNLAIGYSDGDGEVRVMFYGEGTLLNCYTVNGSDLAWS